jgi:hypothetical protein
LIAVVVHVAALDTVPHLLVQNGAVWTIQEDVITQISPLFFSPRTKIKIQQLSDLEPINSVYPKSFSVTSTIIKQRVRTNKYPFFKSMCLPRLAQHAFLRPAPSERSVLRPPNAQRGGGSVIRPPNGEGGK